MTSPLQWIVVHWNGWGVNGVVAAIASATTWILARRKEWKESRREKANRKIDAAVYAQIRPIGNYAFLFDSEMIARALSMDRDAVADSLERLEIQGKVSRQDGTLEHPAPLWSAIIR